MRELPGDCRLLPLREGALLVSADHATWCRVSPSEQEPLARALISRVLEPLPGPLLENLASHGFFGPPRPLGPQPPTVQIQLTNACNLACTYCCTHSGPARPAELQLQELLSVVRQIPVAMGPNARVAILGGEPFLVPWAVELANAILDQRLELTLFSNGLPLIDPELARRVAGLMERGASLRISLASASAPSCDGLSGAARFEGALQAIALLAELGALPFVDLMVAPQNVQDLASSLPELRRRLPAGIRISVGLLFMGGREQGEHLFATRTELEAALDRVAFEAGELIPSPAPSPQAHRRLGCACGQGHHLHLRSDGSYFTCFRMEEPLGQLRETGFSEMAARVAANPRPSVNLEACRDCPLVTICGGGCRSDNLLHTGDPERPLCGPWRVAVLSELLAEDRPHAVEWPTLHLLAEAHARGIPAPAELPFVRTSLHLADDARPLSVRA